MHQFYFFTDSLRLIKLYINFESLVVKQCLCKTFVRQRLNLSSVATISQCNKKMEALLTAVRKGVEVLTVLLNLGQTHH